MKLNVEFLGQARRLAQTRECPVEMTSDATYRDVLRHLASRFPALVGPIILPTTHDLAPAYLININGRHAVKDLDAPAMDGQRLIFMFMEAGG
jgi:hypothetical protein